MTAATPPAKRRAKEVRRDFNQKLMQASVDGWEPDCYERPGDFVDRINTATAEEAAALCADCPALAICKEMALIERPPSGVMGGLSWKTATGAQLKGRQVLHGKLAA